MLAIVDYKKGNLQSVAQGFARAGVATSITSDPQEIAQARAVVLPGVGSFADAAASMRELGLIAPVKDAIAKGTPFLGICLGLQLLFEAGEEHAQEQAEAGLGIIPGVVSALPSIDAEGNSYKIPHVGWNKVTYDENSVLFDGIAQDEFFYFTHSYIVPESDATIATTTHSKTFPCAVQVGSRAFAVQFHPEKSSDAGAALLRNFISLVED